MQVKIGTCKQEVIDMDKITGNQSNLNPSEVQKEVSDDKKNIGDLVTKSKSEFLKNVSSSPLSTEKYPVLNTESKSSVLKNIKKAIIRTVKKTNYSKIYSQLTEIFNLDSTEQKQEFDAFVKTNRNAINKQGYTFLLKACKEDRSDIAEGLCSHKDINIGKVFKKALKEESKLKRALTELYKKQITKDSTRLIQLNGRIEKNGEVLSVLSKSSKFGSKNINIKILQAIGERGHVDLLKNIIESRKFDEYFEKLTNQQEELLDKMLSKYVEERDALPQEPIKVASILPLKPRRPKQPMPVSPPIVPSPAGEPQPQEPVEVDPVMPPLELPQNQQTAPLPSQFGIDSQESTPLAGPFRTFPTTQRLEPQRRVVRTFLPPTMKASESSSEPPFRRKPARQAPPPPPEGVSRPLSEPSPPQPEQQKAAFKHVEVDDKSEPKPDKPVSAEGNQPKDDA